MLNPTKFYLFFLIVGLCQNGLVAQNSWTVKGIIKGKGSGLIIPFATVKVKYENKGTIANEMGEFSLSFDQQPRSDAFLVFRSVGYKLMEFELGPMLGRDNNQVELEVDAIDLGVVMVSKEKQLKVKDLLKNVIARIPSNYRSEPFTYDAYYRESVKENGVDIRFVDAAVTFTQKGYNGKVSEDKAGFWSLVPLGNSAEGIMMGNLDDFYEEVHAKSRFHDHFGHPPTTENTVLIHESRRSEDFSKFGMLANSEGGPLSTLDKDLVLDLDLFLRKSHFGKYKYDLFEVPNDQGSWDYLIKFVPKRAALTIDKVASMRASNKRIMRSDILSGTLKIDKESLAIKSITFSVENDYRRHICSFKSQALKHFGYEVSLDYKEFEGKWQVDRIYRKHEFVFINDDGQVTTPFESLAEIVVTEPKSEFKSIPLSKSFVNVWTNVLYDYKQPYNAEFWNEYEEKYEAAKISGPLRINLTKDVSLESQFKKMGLVNDK